MILDSLIQIVSVLLAFTLLGTFIATSIYYARYKMNNKSPAQAAAGAVSANWEQQAPQLAKPTVISKKRLHFRTAPLREHVS